MLPCEVAMGWLDAEEETWEKDGTDAIFCDELDRGVEEAIADITDVLGKDKCLLLPRT
jgi:hypothetical protein